MLTAAIVILFLILQTATAGSQEPHFETSLLTVYRAISQGKIKKALLFYETQAHDSRIWQNPRNTLSCTGMH